VRVRVQKWGNSLAVRIPKALAEEVAASEHTEMDLVVERGRLVLSPAPAPRYSLAGLLAQVTGRNRHVAEDLGAAIGREVL
jgi:antitoxin MazE